MADDIYGMTFYLCDQKKECSDRDGCQCNGGYCIYTTDEKHAKNGPIKNKSDLAKRFRAEHYESCIGTYYWERNQKAEKELFDIEQSIKELEGQIEAEKEDD